MPLKDQEESLYTVYLRFPFPREGFSDPNPVAWNSEKEQELWSILSRTSKRTDIKWPQLAEYFQASIPFLLQQAAWLYERELQQVSEEMQRVTIQNSMLLNQSGQRSLSSEGAGTPGSDDIRRLHTYTRRHDVPSHPSDDTRSIASRYSADDPAFSSSPGSSPQQAQQQQSQQFVSAHTNERRPMRTSYIQSSFNRQTPTQQSRASPQPLPHHLYRRNLHSSTPPSRESSPLAVGVDASRHHIVAQNSTGSSFSDLSDASISRSALEEALLSEVNRNGRAGAGTSKMSMLSGVLRSRYFDPR
ncbi:uncharacterized protein V2V93DRAFT_364608 [Kockiozyma suomiensis]|uniref:uncharacterized protein n=1 Tax=Kockiozyma suomiensis TaxID=1337062 RepID=UPI003343AD62